VLYRWESGVILGGHGETRVPLDSVLGGELEDTEGVHFEHIQRLVAKGRSTFELKYII